ncbi:MAG: LysM peptidoglycan-binding domain-containing protein [Bacteroidota bacterium]
MRYKFLILVLVLFSKFNGFSQEKYIKHEVAKGETISKIAEQYNIKTTAIYELNPDAKKGIKFKQILLVPVSLSNDKKVVAETSTSNLPQKEHLVLPKETLYGIAKQYGVKITDLNNLNPGLEKRGLRVGSAIHVPATAVPDLVADNSSSNKTEVVKREVKEEVKPKLVEVITGKKDMVASVTVDSNNTQVKEILPNETLYGIARQYGIKVADLNNLNPGLEQKGLRVGSTINVPAVSTDNNLVVENSSKIEVVKAETKEEEKPKVVEIVEEKKAVVAALTIDANGNQFKEVLAKETLYGIARDYGVSVADLEKANPVLLNQSLRIGQKLIVPIANNQTLTKDNIVVKNEEVKKETNTETVISVTAPVDTATEIKTTIPTVIETKPTTAVVSTSIETKQEDNAEVEVTHEVLAKETKYGIAKEFGLTIKQLEEQNPKIANRLLVGEKLNIRTLKSNVKVTPKFDFTDTALVNEEPKYDVKAFHGTDFIDQLISTASENIGVRYRTGGTTTEGFDCSGLMCSAFGAYDIQLPRTSLEQSEYGVKINAEEAKKGDLIFFKTNGRSRINHVGMVVEVGPDGEIKFIHASVGNGVIISSNKETYYSKRVTQINRVL